MSSDYGRHLSFPFHIGNDGRSAQVRNLEEHVKDELEQLLLTDPGERIFLPEFGAGLRRLVFEPTGEASRGVTKAMITQAIARWLGERVKLEALEVMVKESTIDVEIKYRIAGTEDSRIMRFQRVGDIG